MTQAKTKSQKNEETKEYVSNERQNKNPEKIPIKRIQINYLINIFFSFIKNFSGI